MKRGILLGFIFVLILAGFASSYDTVIKINTLGDHKLNMQFLNPSPPPISYNATTVDSGSSGIVDYVFSNSAEVFDLSLFLMNNGGTILYEKFEGITAGKVVMITFVPGLVEIDKDYQEAVVETVELVSVENESSEATSAENQTDEGAVSEESGTAEQQEISAESSEGSSSFSGFSSIYNSYGPKLFYYGGGVLLLALILFFGRKHISVRLKKSPKSKKKVLRKEEEALEEAKKKLREMQEIVDGLSKKKEDRIKDAKKKLIEDEKELMKLRRGEDD